MGAPQTDSTAERFPVVGLGASAGGLTALQAFIAALPSDSGMAFVVITHQHPNSPSLLPELLAHHTELPVDPVDGPKTVKPNTVYVAPPGVDLVIEGGRLIPKTSETRLRIDHFFRSLALDQRESAVGVILSGTGTDGTLGLEAIKGASGLVMAQAETSAEFSGMPHSAIGTELMDHIGEPADLPGYLISYARSARQNVAFDAKLEQQKLRDVFKLLERKAGHDFSHYKRSTIQRRIERRMNVNRLDSVAGYVKMLETHPGEVDLLFREFLIGVTSFFRDAEAFESLRKNVIAPLVAEADDDKPIRVWVPGCSTGEEAYSIAMLLRSEMDKTRRYLDAQIFATDLDAHAIDIARSGAYQESVEADLDREIVERFFVKEDSLLRIRKEIRETVIFAPQNLIADPPFTKLDLLSCRNLLIYLDATLQQKLIPLFHYALRPNGVLFLGASESIGGFGNLFDAVDRTAKIFRRRATVPAASVERLKPFASLGMVPRANAADTPDVSVGTSTIRTIERLLLSSLVPPSVLMHERGEIMHIHGRTGRFLEPAPGPQTRVNVFNMAREGLDVVLAATVREATNGEEAIRPGVVVRTNGDRTIVDVRVRRISNPEGLRGMYLLSFENARPPPAPTDGDEPTQIDLRQSQLEDELKSVREVHQSTVEELESANEELKSTNEELQSTNEELQSTNEELETSKEEMQSLNEELQTVNAELQSKVEELSRINDDMKNLLNGTDIGTVFLDNELRITRYTEQAQNIIRMIPSDVGRPVSDLTTVLLHDGLKDDAAEVLRTLVPRETEVTTVDGSWFLLRILPYRTTDNVIDGLVITFVDISAVKKLQQRQRWIVEALAASPTTAFGQDTDLRYVWSTATLFGRSEDEIVGKYDEELVDGNSEALTNLKRSALDRAASTRGNIQIEVADRRGRYDVFVSPTHGEDGDINGISGIISRLED